MPYMINRTATVFAWAFCGYYFDWMAQQDIHITLNAKDANSGITIHWIAHNNKSHSIPLTTFIYTNAVVWTTEQLFLLAYIWTLTHRPYRTISIPKRLPISYHCFETWMFSVTLLVQHHEQKILDELILLLLWLPQICKKNHPLGPKYT